MSGYLFPGRLEEEVTDNKKNEGFESNDIIEKTDNEAEKAGTVVTTEADDTNKTEADSKKKRNEALDWLFHIAVAVIVGLLIVTFVAQRTIVHDISMEPTLTEGDNVLVEKLSYRFGWLKRGDIIVFTSPEEDRQLIKRLVAVEGDRVEVRDGMVYVNGELSLIGLPKEPYTPDGNIPEHTDLTVPEGMIYILGDNRSHSLDSTEFGPIDEEWITGRAIFRFFPFNRFGAID